MVERTTLEVIAPTVEQALAQGLAQLGLTADAVSVEVLDAGSRGLFGLGGRQVRVRLTVNMPPQPEAGAAAAEQPEERGPVPIPAPATTPAPGLAAPAPIQPHDALLDTTEAVVSKLLSHLGLQAQVSACYAETQDEHRPIIVNIHGKDLGVLIGRRGEILNAFQYIASLMVGKASGQFVRLVVDVEGHRERRERQLRQLARRMAEQVIKTGRKLSLEPMSAAERRIIHLELRDHPAVTTQSSGEEPHRKVTIYPKDS